MRRVIREDLDPQIARTLTRRQADADRDGEAGTLDVAVRWKSARQSNDLLAVHAVLKRMAGPRERCMYCLDSHATDIEHFWPKAKYPERMFAWLNLLLSCAECGRFKGERFPLDGLSPLLVDPTAEDPWRFLDFEPQTGIVMARYDITCARQEPKGVATVDLLQLNQREALSHGYLRTYSRLRTAVEGALTAGVPDAGRLLSELRTADDHGLLGWCFSERGAQEVPFKDLRARHSHVWNYCATAIVGR